VRESPFSDTFYLVANALEGGYVAFWELKRVELPGSAIPLEINNGIKIGVIDREKEREQETDIHTYTNTHRDTTIRKSLSNSLLSNL